MIIITLLLFLLQVTVLPQLLLYRLRVDLLLIWVVSYAMLTSSTEGLVFGLCVGLLLDLSIAYPFGLQILCKGLTGYLAGNFASTYFRDQLRLPLMVSLAALLGQEAFIFAFYYLTLGSLPQFSEAVAGEFIWLFIYTVLAVTIIYYLQVRLIKWLERTAYERSSKK